MLFIYCCVLGDVVVVVILLFVVAYYCLWCGLLIVLFICYVMVCAI